MGISDWLFQLETPPTHSFHLWFSVIFAYFLRGQGDCNFDFRGLVGSNQKIPGSLSLIMTAHITHFYFLP